MKIISCFLCHKTYADYTYLKAHIRNYHEVKHDVDLLTLMQHMTDTEKLALENQLGERISKKSGMINEHDDSEVSEGKNMYENDHGVKNKDSELSGVARCITPDVASKISFWKEIENSPQHAVKEYQGLKFFNKSQPSDNRELLRRTLSQHLNGEKSADDTIDIFDEIFATSCDDMNESVDGRFRMLLEDEPCEVTVSGNCSSTSDSSSEAESDIKLDEVPIVKQARKESSSKKLMNITDGKYACKDCGKTFKFLTYLKGHINSKVGCKTRKQVPLYIR